jgi:hypothetical protein
MDIWLLGKWTGLQKGNDVVRKMSLREAVDLVPDDLPDGAFWAMAHELAGAEYGDVWHELEEPKKRTVPCPQCGKKFKTEHHMLQHIAAMARNGTHTRVQF